MLHREIGRVKESRYQRVLGCSFAIGPLSSCLAPSAIYSRLETLDEIPYCSRPSVIYGDNGEYMLGCSQEFLGAWSKFFSQCRIDCCDWLLIKLIVMLCCELIWRNIINIIAIVPWHFFVGWKPFRPSQTSAWLWDVGIGGGRVPGRVAGAHNILVRVNSHCTWPGWHPTGQRRSPTSGG